MPYAVLWLRYTTFIPLYPIGVASELSMVYLALPTIRSSHAWSIDMPNTFNFGFDYALFCVLVVIGYIPGGVLGGVRDGDRALAQRCRVPGMQERGVRFAAP